MRRGATWVLAVVLALGTWYGGTVISGGAAAPSGVAAAWGLDADGQLGVVPCCAPRPAATPVASLSPFTAIAAGERHSLAVSAGTVWVWGSNDAGQLGLPTEGNVIQPTPLPTLSGITAVAAGAAHSLALRSDGTVWSWGDNVDGDLGKGDQTPSDVPAPVVGLAGVKRIAAAGDMSMALRRDGRVVTWGANDNGQLGTGTRTPSATPVEVPGLSGIVALATGGDHVLAVARDGAVWAWGSQGKTDSTKPRSVSGLPNASSGANRIVALAAGTEHSLALTAGGAVWAWGDNTAGQRGSAAAGPLGVAPQRVTGLPPVVSIAAAGEHSLAVDHTGIIWGWGANGQGQVGIGSRSLTGCQCVPRPAGIGRVSGVVRIAAGPFDSLAIAATVLPPATVGPAAVCAGKHRARGIAGAIIGGNNLLNLTVSESTHHLFIFNGETYDQATERLICAASVTTVDSATGRIVRSARLGLGGATGSPGFALDDGVQRLLVLNAGNLANDYGGSVSVLDTQSGGVLTVADAGQSPNGVQIDARTYRAMLTFTRAGHGIARLLAVTRGFIVRDQPVDEPGRAVLVDERAGRMLLPGDQSVTTLDARHAIVIRVLRFPFGVYSGAAVLNGRLFVALSGSGKYATAALELVNTRTGLLARRVAEGPSTQLGSIVADAPAGRVLLAQRTSGAASLLSVRAYDGTQVATLPITLGPAAVDPRNGRVYTISGPGTVTELAPRPWRVVRTIHLGRRLTAITLSVSSRRAYVVDRGAGVVRSFGL